MCYFLIWFSDREAAGLRSRSGTRENHRGHGLHRRTHVPHEMVCNQLKYSHWMTDAPVVERNHQTHSHPNKTYVCAGKIRTRLTLCRRRRPTSSVRRWSSPSTRRDSPGTRIPPRMTRRTRRTSAGETDGVVFHLGILWAGGKGYLEGPGVGWRRQARHHSSWSSFQCSSIWICFYLDIL